MTPLDPTGLARTVLVVDDSPEDAEVVRRLLRRAPDRAYAVRHVQLASDALVAIRDDAARPDVVLLDHGLPDMSGLDLLHVLAGEAGGTPVPVVMLTGTHAHVDTAVSAMRHGALDYLAKDSLSADALRRAIDGAVDRFASGRMLAAQRAELERRHRALDAATARTSRLLAIVTALGGALTPDDVARTILDELMPAVGAVMGMMVVVRAPTDGEPHPTDPVLDLVRSVGLPAAVRDAWRYIAIDADVPLAHAVRTGEPGWVTSIAPATAPSTPLAGLRAAVGYKAAATVPLIVSGNVVGAVALGFPEVRAFGAEEQAFLLTVARQCAQALERARLYAAEHAARAEAEAARADAERANRAKAQFLAAMSHELRTPLNAIAGYAELMEMGIRGPVTPEQREDLARVRRAGQHLQSLINDILNHARLEAGTVRYDLQTVLLDGVVADVEALVAPQLRARSLAFSHDGCAPDTPARPHAVRADGEKVRQILLNLMTNAIKFTAPGGRIELACATECDAEGRPAVIRLRVSDTGRGIAANALAQIFEPFVQVDR
ncbi:MAG TPA: histidine kinase dimerization/phospho-acceptor domain-containing protein, partial [Gemmatirosa sp.]